MALQPSAPYRIPLLLVNIKSCSSECKAFFCLSYRRIRSVLKCGGGTSRMNSFKTNVTSPRYREKRETGRGCEQVPIVLKFVTSLAIKSACILTLQTLKFSIQCPQIPETALLFGSFQASLLCPSGKRNVQMKSINYWRKNKITCFKIQFVPYSKHALSRLSEPASKCYKVVQI